MADYFCGVGPKADLSEKRVWISPQWAQACPCGAHRLLSAKGQIAVQDPLDGLKIALLVCAQPQLRPVNPDTSYDAVPPIQAT
jgi:hypothetical protein